MMKGRVRTMEHTTKIKYEYKHDYLAFFPPAEKDDPGKEIFSSMLQERLNSYAEDGWELVSISESLLNLSSVDGYGIFRRLI